MKVLKGNKKLLACLVAAGLTASVVGGSPVEAKSSDASAATLEEQMTQLQARMAELEEQLKAVKASEKATKEQLKKKDKSKSKIVWTGSIKSGIEMETNKQNKLKSEFRLYGDANMGEGWSANIGIKIKSTTEMSFGGNDGSYKDGYEKNKILLNAANVKKEFGKFGKEANTGAITIGTMKAKVGEGLWLSKGGTNQFLGEYYITKNDLFRVSYGYDAHDYLCNEYDGRIKWKYKDGKYKQDDPSGPSHTRLLYFFDYKHIFAKKSDKRIVDQYAGLYFGKQQPERYFGIYGRTPIVGKLWASGEYITNNNTDRFYEDDMAAKQMFNYGYDCIGSKNNTKGYVFELHYGNAKKAGDWEFAISWLKADQNLFMNDKYTAFDDYLDQVGYKGFGAELSYQLSKASKLSFIRYWGHTVSDPDNVSAKGKVQSEDTKNQVYIKLTTKF